MPTRTLKGGFSLAEVVVATGLFAVISLILSGWVVRQMRFCTRANERLGLEREQMLLEESLRQDLMATAAAGITLDPGGSAIAMQPVADVAPDGFLVYSTSRLNVYRYEPTGWLHRYAWQVRPLAFALQQTPQRLGPSEWSLLLTRPPDRNLHWTRLKSFLVSSQLGPGDVGQRITFDTTWLDERGLQQTLHSCFFTRQNP